MKAIDFFCGAGGMTKGFFQAGINVIAGIDFDANCMLTYESNNKPSEFFMADIKKIEPSEIQHFVDQRENEPLVFVAAPPCQPFSNFNNKKEYKTEARLLGDFLKFVSFYLPDYLVIENVPGIARVSGNSTYNKFVKNIKTLGYKIEVGVLDAKEFGTPQTRRRLIMIASSKREPAIPKPTHGPELIPFVTVKEAIRAFPRIKAGTIHPSVANHQAASITEINMNRLRNTPKNGGGRADWPNDLWLECHKNGHKGHTDVYGRMWWEKPAPTITCRSYSISNGRFGHPRQNRAISLREAAALQGFPNDFIFVGDSMKAIANQIGNAVPVPLAKAIGLQLLDLQSRL